MVRESLPTGLLVMLKYAFIFTLVQFLVSFLLNTLLEMIGVSSSASTVPSILAGSFVAGHFFAAWEKRMPEPREANRYALISLGLTWVVTALILALLLNSSYESVDLPALMSLLTERFYLAIFGALAVVLSLVIFFANRWGFSWIARHRLTAAQA